MALNLCHRSLAELIIIAEQIEKGNNSVCNSDTIRFYRFTLHYMFVLEICKLLEAKNISKEANYASLKRLNNQFFELFNDQYEATYKEINEKFDHLIVSDLYEKIKNFRDKKLAHSDEFQEYGPLNFKGFSKDELRECKVFLEQVTQLFNRCVSEYEFEIHFLEFSTTLGFLTNYEDYKRYAFLDFQKFMSWKMDAPDTIPKSV